MKIQLSNILSAIRKIIWKKTVLVGLAFAILGGLAAMTCSWGWVGDSGLSWHTKASNWPQGGDTGSYREFAFYLLRGDLSSWTMSNWAPGYAFMTAFSILTMGEEFHAVKMLLLHLILWAVAFTVFWQKVRFFKSDLLRFLVLAGVIWLPFLKEWIFGLGVLHSESSTHAFFVIASAFIIEGLIASRQKSLWWGAFYLGVTANFRSVLDYQLGACLTIVVALTFLHCLLNWLYNESDQKFITYCRDIFKTQKLYGPKWALRTSVIFFLIFQATVSPWKIKNWIMHNEYKFTVVGTNLEWIFQWNLDKELASMFGGMNSACHANMELCLAYNQNIETLGGIGKQLAVMTLIDRPDKWVGHRWERFDSLWFGGSWEMIKRNYFQLFEGYLYLFGFLVFVPLMAISYLRANTSESRSRCLTYMGIVYLFTVMNIGMMLILHFESRYSLTWRIGWLLAGLGALDFYFRLRKQRKMSAESI